MKKIALKAVGLLAIGALAACGGGPSSQLANTNWSSTTVGDSATSSNVMTLTYAIHFGVPTTNTTTAATGPFTATLTQQYGATGNRAGCMIVTTMSGGTYIDTFSQTDNTMGSYTVSGGTISEVASGCMDTTENGTTTSSVTLLPDGGGSNSYTLNGSTMTLSSSSNSGLPYHGSTWTFMKTAM